MKIGRSRSPVHCTINGEMLEEVSKFKYLGTIITEEGRCEKEIATQIAMAKHCIRHGRKINGKKTKVMKI